MNLMGKLDANLLRALRESSDHQDYPVIIEFRESVELPANAQRALKEELLDKRTKSIQSSVVSLLESLGITKYSQLVLSNSLSTRLSVTQLLEIASRPEVKRIRLLKTDQITTG